MKKFKGAFTALITPMDKDKVDYDTFISHVKAQIKGKIDGLVPCGTTGESATLTHEEHKKVIEVCIETANKKVPVIAGTGSNSTAETITLTQHAEKAGASAALVISPYYNKPSQQGVYEHYKKISESTSLPIIMYNVPGRTCLDMTPETVARLSELKNIIGIKEATGDIDRASQILEYSKENFLLISGDDFITYPMLCLGGHGVISVTSNIMPAEVSKMCEHVFNKNYGKARKLHYMLQSLHRSMFIETNPVPCKTTLALMGQIKEDFRLPLVKMSTANKTALKKVLKSYNLI